MKNNKLKLTDKIKKLEKHLDYFEMTYCEGMWQVEGQKEYEEEFKEFCEYSNDFTTVINSLYDVVFSDKINEEENDE